MDNRKETYMRPQSSVINLNAGNVMEELGMSDNKEATEIQSKEAFFDSFEDTGNPWDDYGTRNRDTDE
ncbi:MAG: hypothetical protein SOZ80_01770 [Prevotella sp.]|uniref:hypothetical protein n=1 Tax=Prevotella sp. TaxID=59823 RepID=UPI002A27ECF6|nr:hypothetical protein [Prevotella sp.]MDD7317397.1 hypothetical protein [Prevotellaceae bacterium]MDY4019495.1 hypothetical protein [Prevotella sp.]